MTKDEEIQYLREVIGSQMQFQAVASIWGRTTKEKKAQAAIEALNRPKGSATGRMLYYAYFGDYTESRRYKKVVDRIIHD